MEGLKVMELMAISIDNWISNLNCYSVQEGEKRHVLGLVFIMYIPYPTTKYDYELRDGLYGYVATASKICRNSLRSLADYCDI